MLHFSIFKINCVILTFLKPVTFQILPFFVHYYFENITINRILDFTVSDLSLL